MCNPCRSLLLTLATFFCLSVSFAPMPGAMAQVAQPALVTQAHSAHSAQVEDRTIPALLISDIHFDPFHDPAKVEELVAAPVTQWKSILSSPPSSNQQQAFTALQQSCHARGVDTPFALLHSSLQAM